MAEKSYSGEEAQDGKLSCNATIAEGWCKGDTVSVECDTEKGTASFTRTSRSGDREERVVKLEGNLDIFKDPGHEEESLQRLSANLEQGMSPEEAMEKTAAEMEHERPIRQRNEDLDELKGHMRATVSDMAGIMKSTMRTLRSQIAVLSAAIEEEQKRQEQERASQQGTPKQEAKGQAQEEAGKEPQAQGRQEPEMGNEGPQQEAAPSPGAWEKIKGYVHQLRDTVAGFAARLSEKINELAQEAATPEQLKEMEEEAARESEKDTAREEETQGHDATGHGTPWDDYMKNYAKNAPQPVVLGNIYKDMERKEPEAERNEMGETKEEHERMSEFVRKGVEAPGPQGARESGLINTMAQLARDREGKQESPGKHVSISLRQFDGATFTRPIDLSGLGLTNEDFPQGCTFNQGLNVSGNPDLTAMEATVYGKLDIRGDYDLDLSEVRLDENAAVIDPYGDERQAREFFGEEPEITEEQEADPQEQDTEGWMDVPENAEEEEEWEN